MAKPKLVLFDLGGVLFDYSNFLNTCAREQKIDRNSLLKTLGRHAKEATLGKITLQDVYIKFIEENNLNADKSYDVDLSWIRDLVKIEPSYKFLNEISTKYYVGLLSNIFKRHVPLIMERDIIPDIEYSYVFLSCDIGMKKPDDEIYEYVMITTGLNPQEIFYIDDFEENVETAEKYGWQTHLFLTNSPEKSIEILTDWLL